MLHTTLSKPKIFQNLNEMNAFLEKSRIIKLHQRSKLLESNNGRRIFLISRIFLSLKVPTVIMWMSSIIQFKKFF